MYKYRLRYRNEKGCSIIYGWKILFTSMQGIGFKTLETNEAGITGRTYMARIFD